MNTLLLIIAIIALLYFLYRNGKTHNKYNNTLPQNYNQLKLDGYYFAYFNSKNSDGIPFCIPYIFMFNKNGLVLFAEAEQAENIKNVSFSEWKENIKQFGDIRQFEISKSQSKYFIERGYLKMLFYIIDDFTNNHMINNINEEPNEYTLWEGRILENGLLLSHTIVYFNASLSDYTEHSFFKDLKFEFVKINQSRY